MLSTVITFCAIVNIIKIGLSTKVKLENNIWFIGGTIVPINYDNIKNSFTDMPKGESFICSFSGGKDSALALSMACEVGNAKGIIHWSDKEENSSIFHCQNLSIIKEQAKCMDIPLTIVHNIPWENTRLKLVNLYKDYRKQGIKSIVFGDILDENSLKYQVTLCRVAGLTPRYPIWRKSHSELMVELENRHIKTIITRINTDLLDAKWLGKVYDRTIYKTFCFLDINPFGEYGEFHTTVVNADIFKDEMRYSLDDSSMTDDQAAIGLSTHSNPKPVPLLFQR